MISKTYFEDVVKPLLQKLGNFRTPYLIFIEQQVEQSEYAQKTINLNVHSKLYRGDFSIDDLQIADKNANVVIVIDTAERAKEFGWQYLFNELHVLPEHSELCNEHCKMIATSVDDNVFAQRPIELHQMRAYDSKDIVVNGVKAEPYHTLGRILNTDFVVLYVWDTREVVAVEHRNDIDWSKRKDINDNQRPLFIGTQLVPAELEHLFIRV